MKSSDWLPIVAGIGALYILEQTNVFKAVGTVTGTINEEIKRAVAPAKNLIEIGNIAERLGFKYTIYDDGIHVLGPNNVNVRIAKTDLPKTQYIKRRASLAALPIFKMASKKAIFEFVFG